MIKIIYCNNFLCTINIIVSLGYNNFAMSNGIVISKKLTETNAGIIVKTLIKQGVDSIFGYPGAAVLSIYNELSQAKEITHYLVRHEQAAVHAAEGYARVCGKTGVVLVTSGPGFTNTITGIANAYADSTPLVVLIGDISSESISGKMFQNIDIESVVTPCSKKVYKLQKNDNAAQITEQAFIDAQTGKKGPVVIILPRNILESECLSEKENIAKPIIPAKSFEKESEKLTKLIEKSTKPLILIGGGGLNSSVEINNFAKLLSCPIVSTLMGIGIYPSEDRNYLGMIGINGTYQANAALNNADLIIAIGSAFSDRSTCKNGNFAKKAKIVSINIDKISEDFELNIISDASEFLNFYIKNYKNIKYLNKWDNQINIIKSEMYENEDSSDRLHSSFVLKTISDYTKSYEPIIVTDVGQHQMLTAQFFNFNKPRKFITSGGMGTMGFGLPASIGAYTANPDNLIINITGDGSFQMNLQELATCREHNIPIKIVIMNNGYLAMVRQMQEKIYKNRYQVEMTNPDFVKIAEAYDLMAIRVKQKEELKPAIEKAIQHSGTVILDVMIDFFENI